MHSVTLIEIPLTQSKIALIDELDFDRVRKHRWFACIGSDKQYEARTYINGETVSMHRLILRAPEGYDVDHRNGYRLDNRRENLRFATRKQNAWNRRALHGKFKGVSPRKRGTFVARIQAHGIQYTLGTFLTETEAALAYNEAAKLYFGDFAWLNPVGEEKNLRELRQSLSG